MKICTPDERAAITARYTAGERAEDIAADYGCNRATVWNIARASGAPRRTTRRICELDETAFDTITPESAYWIGFLMADGCVRAPNAVEVGLQRRDEGHLEKFRAFVGGSQKIRHILQNGKYPSSHFAFSSTQITSVLATHGIVPNKSLTAKTSEEMANNKDFWLGVVDGDGSIGVYKARARHPNGEIRFSVCGSVSLVGQFLEYARTIIPPTKTKVRFQSRVHRVDFAGLRAATLVRELYADADTYLDRKYETAKRILQLANDSGLLTS